MCGEEAMEAFLERGTLSDERLAGLVAERKLFPCCFGSALKLEGVDRLLDCLDRYTRQPAAPEDFGARVFKIARDGQGNRLTYLKVTGGVLKVKDLLTGPAGAWEETSVSAPVSSVMVSVVTRSAMVGRRMPV